MMRATVQRAAFGAIARTVVLQVGQLAYAYFGEAIYQSFQKQTEMVECIFTPFGEQAALFKMEIALRNRPLFTELQ